MPEDAIPEHAVRHHDSDPEGRPHRPDQLLHVLHAGARQPGADDPLRRFFRRDRRVEEEYRPDRRARTISRAKPFATELGTVDYQEAKTTSEALVKAGKPAIDIRTFGTYADVLQALSANQVAGAFIGVEQAAYYQKKGATFFRIAVSGLIPHAEALAFKDPALADAVAKVMNEMKADGSFDKIFAPYGHCVLPGPYKVTSGPLPPFTCPSPQGIGRPR